MAENQQEVRICDHCGCEIENEDYALVGEEFLCQDCVDEHCVRCDRCEELIYAQDSVQDDDITLCEHCYENHYTRCECCGSIIRNEDSYYSNDYDYCCDCYNRKCRSIHDYHFKPAPAFYGDSKRYFGVELEVDYGGHDDEKAEEILDAINYPDERIYIKSDGSLDDGFEIVTHPMSLNYHMNKFPWDDLTDRLIHLGYRSHQTSTCGLHIHVSRDGLGDSYDEQENTISHILFFVEMHWNELLRFSRRSEYSMNRWAARHGYEHDPKKLLGRAKSSANRYVAVNLCNCNTVEFRLFRGTLKLNTILATLQLVNRICGISQRLSDAELQALSWSEFVTQITDPELIQYLKERRLYVNEPITEEEET